MAIQRRLRSQVLGLEPLGQCARHALVVVLVLAVASQAHGQGIAQRPAASAKLSLMDSKVLALDVVIQQVLSRNPSLSQMAATLDGANSRYTQVRSLDDPMLMAGIAPASFGSRNVEAGYRVEVAQKVPFPGKRLLRGNGALAEASAVGQDVTDTKLRLIEEARIAFYDYFVAARTREVNDETTQLLLDFKRSAMTRYRAGQVTQQDVIQAELEIARQEERSVGIERMEHIAQARLNILMHMPTETPLPPAPGKLKIPTSVLSLEEYTEKALQGRPDLQALQFRLAADETGVSLARKEAYPDFELSAAYDTIMGNGPARDLAPQIGLRINMPIYKARREAALQEALARVSMRHAELDGRTDQIRLQVHEAFEQLEESRRLVQLCATSLIPLARQNVIAARSDYEAAKVSFMTLVEAERSLAAVRDRAYEVLGDYFRRLATLERTAGIIRVEN